MRYGTIPSRTTACTPVLPARRQSRSDRTGNGTGIEQVSESTHFGGFIWGSRSNLPCFISSQMLITHLKTISSPSLLTFMSFNLTTCAFDRSDPSNGATECANYVLGPILLFQVWSCRSVGREIPSLLIMIHHRVTQIRSRSRLMAVDRSIRGDPWNY